MRVVLLDGTRGGIRELYVVVASPYDPASALVGPPAQCTDKNQLPCELHDGRDIMFRSIDLLTNAPFRWDLNFSLTANRTLAIRKTLLEWAGRQSQAVRESVENMLAGEGANAFPVQSANRPRGSRFSLPYDPMIVVTPQKIYADTYGFDPAIIALQLHKGCVLADQAMVDAKKESMREKCNKRFPVPPEALKGDPDPTVTAVPTR